MMWYFLLGVQSHHWQLRRLEVSVAMFYWFPAKQLSLSAKYFVQYLPPFSTAYILTIATGKYNGRDQNTANLYQPIISIPSTLRLHTPGSQPLPVTGAPFSLHLLHRAPTQLQALYLRLGNLQARPQVVHTGLCSMKDHWKLSNSNLETMIPLLQEKASLSDMALM